MAHHSSLLLAFHSARAKNAAEDGPPEWIHILPPKGKVKGLDGREFSISGLRKVVAATKAIGLDLPIDTDHSIEYSGGPAVGWIKGFRSDAKGLWGKVEWNTTGAYLVSTKQYRYVSPAFVYTEDRVVSHLTSVALTNRPNLPQLASLNAREPEDQSMDLIKQIKEALGVEANASNEDVMKALNAKMQPKEEPKPEPVKLDQYVPRADYDLLRGEVAQLKSEQAALHAKEVDQEIAAAVKAGKIAPSSVEYHKAVCSRDDGLVEFRKFVEAQPSHFTPRDMPKPPQGEMDAIETEHKAMCERFGITYLPHKDGE